MSFTWNFRGQIARIGVGLALVLSSAVQAQPVDLNPLLFGHLDQGKTQCPDMGCGPTAAVNSFVYLQTYYSALSGGFKAPAPPTIVTDGSEAGLIALANQLCAQMGCTSTSGTNNKTFADAKRQYLQEHSGGWSVEVNWTQTVTWQWLTDSVKDGVDVELLVTDGALSHYVTVTGHQWTDTNGNGQVDAGESQISIIDPAGGTFATYTLGVTSTGTLTFTGYDLDESTTDIPPVTVTDGYSERLMVTTVPEPSTWAMMIPMMLVVGWVARRRA